MTNANAIDCAERALALSEDRNVHPCDRSSLRRRARTLQERLGIDYPESGIRRMVTELEREIAGARRTGAA